MDQTTFEPPAYSPTYHPPAPARDPVLHKYFLENKNGKQWFTLEVSSKASSPEMPSSILPGEPVAGFVSLNLDSEIRAKSVVVSLVGKFSAGPFGKCKFVEQTAVLWSRDASNSQATTNSLMSRKAKLQGEHRWSFSLNIPSHVELAHNGVSATYPLPATFGTQWTFVFVSYTLQARVILGSFQSDHIIKTVVCYAPVTRPEESSIQRQLSSKDKSSLIGPQGGPDGWKTLDSVLITGTLFNDRVVQIQYQLSLAEPVCLRSLISQTRLDVRVLSLTKRSYTRDSVIPLYLTIRCKDVQALDLLSNPRAISTWLCWSLSLQSDTKGCCFQVIPPGAAGRNLGLQSRQHFDATPSSNARVDNFRVQSAVWWALPVYDKNATNKRELQGEIHLAPNMPLPTHLGGFQFRYNVAVYAPKIAGFSPDRAGRIQIVDVDICTAYANGPRPIAYSTPMYDEPVEEGAEINLGRTRQMSVSPFPHVTLAYSEYLHEQLASRGFL